MFVTSKTPIGIDIGKGTLALCRPDSGPANRWPVYVIELKYSGWHEEVAHYIPQGALVALEPTGYHYSLPVITALEYHGIDAAIYWVNHLTTASMRRLYLSRAKTDNIDARALGLVAQQLAQGEEVRGARVFDPQGEQFSLALRLLLNEHVSLTKIRTRTKNQIDALSHGVWPQLAINRVTYYRALSQGIAAPDDLGAVSASGAAQGAITRLIKAIPPGIPINPYTAEALISRARLSESIGARLAEVDAQIDQILSGPYAALRDAWRKMPAMSDFLIAAAIVATHGRPWVYTLSEFKAAMGAAPHTGISGGIDKTKLKRGAYDPARSYLHLVTMAALKEDNDIARYYARKGKLAPAKRKYASQMSGIARALYQGGDNE